MPISGLVAGGFQNALDDVNDRRLKELVRQLQERAHADQVEQQKASLALQTRSLEGVEQDRADDNARQTRLVDLAELKRTDDLASAATDRNVGLDAANVMGMPGMTPEARASELQQSVLRNPTAKSGPAMLKMIEGLTKVPEKKFTSPQRLADGSIAQFEEGHIPAGTKFYQEPKTPTKPDKPDYQRVLIDGKETFLTPEEVRARGGVDAASRKRASTGIERQTLGFYNRMKDALDTMDAVEDQVSERDLMLINNSPLPDLINNRLLSSAGQQYAQALQTYTEGRLRKESGAAIANTEYENDRKTVGRQANDQPDVREQKKQTRRKTHEGIGYAAGPAYEEFFGEPFQRMESFSVKAPNGKTYTFKSAEELSVFKAKAGIP